MTMAKLASGTAGKFIGYDVNGDPAELDGPAEPDITDDTVTDKGIYSPRELHNEFGEKSPFQGLTVNRCRQHV